VTLDPDVLLAGPRGRGVLVHLFDDVAIRTLVNRADAPANRGASGYLWGFSTTPPRGFKMLAYRAQMRRERAKHQREMRKPVSPAEMAAAIAAATMPSVGAAGLVEALGRTVDDAKPWQPSDGSEAVIASDEVRAALAPLAALVAASPFASTWVAPVRPQQWVLDRKDGRLGSEPVPAPTDALATWREAVEAEEREAVKRREKGQAHGGPWGSVPPGSLTHSTSAWKNFGPVGLYLEEDSFGPMAASATPVGPAPENTYEITGADAWARLCGEYPLDVTASREPMWSVSVGQSDEWVIPDWHAMAADWDAVHLTIAGYLAVATTRIAVADGRASVIAGWGPDETVWLRSSPAATSAVVEWRRYQSLGWRMQMTPMEEEA
jgi:hypothetical protein